MVNFRLPWLQGPWFKIYIYIYIFVLMVNFRKGAWKLGENIRCVGGGEIITDKKNTLLTSTPKKVLHDYECSLPESDTRTSFSPFSFFPFLGAGLLMFFHGHSCPSIMIICIQPQTCASGRGCGLARPGFFFLEQLGWCPPGSWCPTQIAYSAYREQRYCTAIKQKHACTVFSDAVYLFIFIYYFVACLFCLSGPVFTKHFILPLRVLLNSSKSF